MSSWPEADEESPAGQRASYGRTSGHQSARWTTWSASDLRLSPRLLRLVVANITTEPFTTVYKTHLEKVRTLALTG